MRWYLLFPILFIIFCRSAAAFVGIAVLAYACNRFFSIPDLGMLPCFMFGIVAAHFVKVKARLPFSPLIAAVALGAAVWKQLHTSFIDHTDPMWHVACFALVVAVTGTPWLRRAFSWSPLVAIGTMSYSIYLFHEPILDALSWSGVSPALAALTAIGGAGVLWYCVERPLCSKRCRVALEGLMLRFGHTLRRGEAAAIHNSPLPALEQ